MRIDVRRFFWTLLAESEWWSSSYSKPWRRERYSHARMKWYETRTPVDSTHHFTTDNTERQSIAREFWLRACFLPHYNPPRLWWGR